MDEELPTETVYEGSRLCPKCGNFMTPVEAMYTGGNLCPTCRNRKYGAHRKARMTA